ncbi:MAG: MerR family DNA-binding protein [Gemmatimonadetes bacterium]|uniref:Mercuric resistance operon regulatory protein n=1 Tax=Candidatus Kutchimonas denitrificans TaxID=3056748 RepID=A0AAE4ZBX7_9BACT|nr:MerR family DNA-binding protein [Gemmatimonadota bacterium]NIR76437.1 MerR family DNA-binding protein [Candidatus Kutchimonas denitrificans]NIS03256.1 MerR family DNA-binding protein [Gemmatimonadota bacterium]NIT69117.1 MerR family DNA-binding protein [Gemmatimonadota bacterium]NIU54509.1 MerR family DNA-binding protein [Gemmatimonadota bacterium]
MQIGELADRARVNVQTIRYYERRGLLAEPERTPSGYRLYAPETIRVVRFIKSAQGLGFSLEEIDHLLELRDSRASSCDEVKELARAKIAAVDEKVRRLAALKGALETLVESCERGDCERECPILEAMEEEPGQDAIGAVTERRER